MTSKFTVTVSQITLTHRIHSQGQASLWFIRCCPGNHFDAVDNRADGETQGTACTSVSNGGQVGFRIKLDSLQTEIKSLAVTAHKGQDAPILASTFFSTAGELHLETATPRLWRSYSNSWAAREEGGEKDRKKKSF